MIQAKYINPFTDYGFKKIFGEEASLVSLKSFLNAVLPPQHQIVDLTFKSSEFMGRKPEDRRAIFDLYCEADSGEKFIVELQRQKQNYFRDRSVFYSTFPIQQQAQQGVWDFKLTPVYCVAILDFCFDKQGEEVLHKVQLKDQKNQVFYDKLTFIYLEMPNFKKAVDELETDLDKWLYFIQNLEGLEDIPKVFTGREEFEVALEKAAIAKLTHEDYLHYEASLKVFRDNYNTMEYQFQQGEKKGLAKGLAEGKAEGLAKGEEIGMQKALERLLATGMSETDARQVLGLD